MVFVVCFSWHSAPTFMSPNSFLTSRNFPTFKRRVNAPWEVGEELGEEELATRKIGKDAT